MLRVRQIKVEVERDSEENLIKAVCKKIRISKEDVIELNIHKQSIDARNKNSIFYVYEVNIKVKNESEVLKKNKSSDVFVSPSLKYTFNKIGSEELNHRPVIVGSGPAGLFAAYILAENNYNPIVIERGEMVEKRLKSVKKFWEEGVINPNSNVQFGEGGAGTFSDGKLNTLVKDENNRGRKVFETFIKFGAPKDILYSYKPHIGTDILTNVVSNMRKEIERMGGTFLFNTCLTNIEVEDNQLKSIEVNNKEKIECDTLILAIGHSARDTFKMLYDLEIKMEAKPFAVGLRVQHSQSDIDMAQFGEKYKDILSPATYKLTYRASNNRGVYSFFMCPGGYVVNASSEEGRLAINGMSYHDRDSSNANSAIVVTVTPEDFGLNPLDGIKYQRELEEKAYEIGKGKIPVQLLKDFKDNGVSTGFKDVKPVFKGEYEFSNINEVLPKGVADSIKEAFSDFGKKIKGFDKEDTILAAIESRTSSPVRIIRNEFFESSIKGIYPCGEGAGYAGGITSAAMDGIKVAEELGRRYIS
jgi:uncharacterized FAD-dependent dehydrogenase